MENLNAEQIRYKMSEKQIKMALKCLSKPNSTPDDREKCYFMWKEPSCFSCYHEVAQNALALITSQEQRIKELTEENESLKQAMEHEHASFMETFGEYGKKCEELIKEVAKRETEYNELYELTTEEIQRLRAEVSVKRKLLNVAEVRIECLEGENNQLKADICNATMNLEHITKENEWLQKYLDDHFPKRIEADTVKKMQERLKAEMSFGRYIQADQIDQIAKEILEGEK